MSAVMLLLALSIGLGWWSHQCARESQELKKQLSHAISENQRIEAVLQESELRFRIVARATNEAVWDWNLATNAVWWNRGVQTLFGYADDQVGPDCSWWKERFHPEDRERIVTGVGAVVHGSEEFWSDEYRFRKADGAYAEIHDRGYVLRDHAGKAIRMIGAMQDITEHKRELAMAKARDAALESARLKSQFLANMSHEIRTPMNSVIGMTALLLKTRLTADQREFAEAVQLSGESLLNIINDILDYSKIEAGKLVFETVDFNVRGTIKDVFKLLAEQAQSKGLKLTPLVDDQVPVTLRGDPGRLRQVLTNLVSNAIKFTEHGGVTVRVVSDSQTATHATIRFKITDTGIGIPETAREHLFQPFSQGDPSTTRKHGGTGLGLAICKQLVQLMAGQIGVESASGKGTTFWFTARFEKGACLLPEPIEEADDLPVPLSETHHRNARILVAEDNVFNQKVVVRQLRDMQFDVAVAANGVEVLAAIDRQAFDLILMDCQMSEMDGYDATVEIRRREGATRHTPIIAMTAHVMPEDREKCLACGMDDFLSKPVREAHLYRVLWHWLDESNDVASQPAASPAQTDAPPVDMEIFQEVAGDEEHIPEVAQRYLEQARGQLAKLAEAIRGGAAADVKRLAHSTASSSAMCGMEELVSRLRMLERLGHAGQLADAPSVYAQVSKEFERIEDFFRSVQSTSKQPAEKSTTVKELTR